MRFLLLLRGDEAAELAMKPEERRAIVEQHMAFSRDLAASGKVVSGEALGASSDARVLRDGVVTDGPYTETKEQLGGFYVIECADVDEAVEIARRVPAGPGHVVEILPVPSVM